MNGGARGGGEGGAVCRMDRETWWEGLLLQARGSDSGAENYNSSQVTELSAAEAASRLRSTYTDTRTYVV